MILLLQHGAVSEDVYTYYRKKLGIVFPKHPLKNPVKMFVVGREGEGKSSLIKAMGDEPTYWSSFVHKFITLNEVEGVGQSTAGIIPRIFNSQYYHQDIQFFDFAGQETYYSSHAAFLKSAVDTCSPVFILVIGLHHEEDARITKSVSYWLGIITEQCPRMEEKAPLIVVASHSDQAGDKNDIDRKTQAITTAVEKFPSFELRTIIPMDCRYSDSDGMELFRISVGECCKLNQSKLSVRLNSHLFHMFLLENYPNKVYTTLKEVQGKIKERLNSIEESKKHKDKISFIPTTIPHLVDICHQLNDKGHIVFLQDETTPENSFIVIAYNELVSEIEKTEFAQHHNSSNKSTGVVPCIRLHTYFKGFDIEMIKKFLMYLKLAHPIKDLEVLEYIQDEKTEPPQDYIFCPALIQVEPFAVSKWYRQQYSHHFGWILSCTKSGHFLDDRFLRVLILRLAFQRKQTESNSGSPALECLCSVWKTGVCWSTADGVEVRVQVQGMKTVSLLIQAQRVSAELFRVQSSSIRAIVEAAVQFLPSDSSEEFLINASSVKSFEELPRVSLKHVAQSIVQKKIYVVTDTGVMAPPLSEFLSMEVYANLGENILQLLFNENDPAHHTRVSDRFIAALVSSWNETPELQTVVFSIFAKEIPGPQKSTDNLETVIKLWRDHNDGTYNSLRLTLDQVSVFAGKNPLVSYCYNTVFVCIGC